MRASTSSSDEPLLHDRLHLLPYLRPEHWEPRTATLTPVLPLLRPLAALQLRRVVQPWSLRLQTEPAPVKRSYRRPKVADPTDDDGAADAPAAAQTSTAQTALVTTDRAIPGNAACACAVARRPLLLHAHGEAMDTVALRDLGGRVDNGDGDDGDDGAPTALAATWKLPERRRVRQLASREGVDRTLLAARVDTCVHFGVAREATAAGAQRRQQLSITDIGVVRLAASVHHVCLSPCVAGEAAALLADGTLEVARIDHGASHGAPSTAGASSSGEVEGFATTITTTEAAVRQQQRLQLPWHGDASAAPDWAAAEYGEHPRTLLVGGGTDIWLADLRAGGANGPVKLFDLATPQLRLPSGDALRALAVPPAATTISAAASLPGPLVAACTCTSLLLLDCRCLRAPLQQWSLPLPPARAQLRQRNFGRKDATASTRARAGVEPPPRYQVWFDATPRPPPSLGASTSAPAPALILMDMRHALPLRYDSRPPQATDAAPQTSASFAAATRTGGVPAPTVPSPPPLPMSLDPNQLLRTRCLGDEAAAPGSALPLAGATTLPPRGDGDGEGGGTARLVVLTAAGAIDCLEPQRETATAEDATAADVNEAGMNGADAVTDDAGCFEVSATQARRVATRLLEQQASTGDKTAEETEDEAAPSAEASAATALVEGGADELPVLGTLRGHWQQWEATRHTAEQLCASNHAAGSGAATSRQGGAAGPSTDHGERQMPQQLRQPLPPSSATATPRPDARRQGPAAGEPSTSASAAGTSFGGPSVRFATPAVPTIRHVPAVRTVPAVGSGSRASAPPKKKRKSSGF